MNYYGGSMEDYYPYESDTDDIWSMSHEHELLIARLRGAENEAWNSFQSAKQVYSSFYLRHPDLNINNSTRAMAVALLVNLARRALWAKRDLRRAIN